MKKLLATFLTFCLMITSVAVFPMTVFAEGTSNTIYVSSVGNNENAGTEESPVKTVNHAISLANSGDTIVLLDTIDLTPSAIGEIAIGNYTGKNITITGGTLDCSEITHVLIRENITFENITLIFTSGKYLFASGYNLTIGEDVIVEGAPNIFSSELGKNCDSPNVTVLSGTFASIYGGGHAASANILNDTNVVVGGNATVSSIYGAGYNSNIGGNVNITVKDNAHITGSVYGGGATAGIVSGSTFVTVTGDAKVDGTVYGGSGARIMGDTNVTISGRASVESGTTVNNRSNVCVMGNYAARIDGDSYVTVTDNAKAGQVFGGGSNTTTDKYVLGNTFVEINGNATASFVYGGGCVGSINKNTNVTVSESANVTSIYGGGYGGAIGGNTYVWVGDDANNACTNPFDHATTYSVYGGGFNTEITGSTNLEFTGNAKANYIYGGNSGSDRKISGGCNTVMSGGQAMSIYGGSNGCSHGGAKSDVHLTMTGGTVEQVFGGNYGSNLTADITVKLLGGTVKRRVYGGCYNETSGMSFSTDYHVNGEITLILGGVSIDFSSSESDESIYARSRHKTPSDTEKTAIIFANESAYNTYKNNLKAQDFAMQLIIGNISAADVQHYYTYSLTDNVITQSCAICGTTGTATITPSGNVYTGDAIEVSVAYNNWEYNEFNVTYTNNVNAGTATATLKIEDFTTQTYQYNIAKALADKMPVVKANNNKIDGLTTDMEFSTDGKNYTKVTDADMTFNAGKYFIRYAGSDNREASRAIMAYVYSGICISANNVQARKGDTVKVIISLSAPVDSATVTVTFDETALSLDGNSTITLSNAKKGTIAVLTFTVNDTAENGNYAISLTCNDGISVVNGSIDVVENVTGDVEGTDGKITSTDIVALRTAIAGGTVDNLSRGADANGDGFVDTTDLVVIRQYLANYDYDAGESTVVLGNNHAE